jgi:ABC-type transporter Mla subunit MlaD
MPLPSAARQRLTPRGAGLIAAVLSATLGLAACGSGAGDHAVTVVVPHATGLKSGFVVRLDGRAVGAIRSVKLQSDYRVRISVGVRDSAWPLPKDTRFVARLGGTIKFGDRYLEIQRGRSPVMLTDGARLPATSYVDPVEFDTVFNLFDGGTRTDLRHTLAAAAPSTAGVRAHLRSAARVGPAAASGVESITGQLGADPRALDRLVRSTAAVTTAATNADPGLGSLIERANTTFAALRAQTGPLKAALAQLPGTLVTARGTITHAGETFRLAGKLTTRLSPGVDELRAVAGPLARLLRAVRTVAPDGTATLASLRRAAPSLDGLVDRVRTPVAGQVERIGREGAKQLDCIRPYSPEIAGLFVNWGGFFGIGDRASKVARAEAGVVPYPNETPLNSGQLAKVLGGSFKMAFPRPPGELVDQPWFQPQCGITADALNPDKDPEALAVDPASKVLVQFDADGGR